MLYWCDFSHNRRRSSTPNRHSPPIRYTDPLSRHKKIGPGPAGAPINRRRREKTLIFSTVTRVPQGHDFRTIDSRTKIISPSFEKNLHGLPPDLPPIRTGISRHHAIRIEHMLRSRGRIACAPSIIVYKRMPEQHSSRLVAASRVSRFVIGPHATRPLRGLPNVTIGGTPTYRGDSAPHPASPTSTHHPCPPTAVSAQTNRRRFRFPLSAFRSSPGRDANDRRPMPLSAISIHERK